MRRPLVRLEAPAKITTDKSNNAEVLASVKRAGTSTAGDPSETAALFAEDSSPADEHRRGRVL